MNDAERILNLATNIVRKAAMESQAPITTASTVRIINPAYMPQDSDGYAVVMTVHKSGSVRLLVPLPRFHYALYIDVPQNAIKRISTEAYNAGISG